MESYVLMNAAMNSRVLMCNFPCGNGLYRLGSAVRTNQSREVRSADDSRHLKSKAEHQPLSPS